MKSITNIGVVGAGTMGSALAQKFAQEGFNVILADREMKYVQKGISGITDMLNQGAERGLFTPEKVSAILSGIKGTDKLADLKECDLVVEAIFENFEAKTALFRDLSEIVTNDAILATNTSSFSVTELSVSVTYPERFIGLHYFYHAAKNRLVEIIPGEKTSEETCKAAKIFSVLSGKDAIFTKDAYGFAVNRFFVPWLNEAVRLLDEGIASIPEIDHVCMRTFGIGMGPFALMNATGVPIAYHAEKTLEIFGPFYNVARLLRTQAEANKLWELENPETVNIPDDKVKVINDRMLGAIYFVCSQILEERVCSPTELNRGAKIGLRWKRGPVEMMINSGEAEVKRLVSNTARIYNETAPTAIGKTFWHLQYVKLDKKDRHAVITIDRPEDLNALSEDVVRQLSVKFTDADNDASIDTIYITGSGKAFVAGADIKFFVKNIQNKSITNIEEFTKQGQHIFDHIDQSKKKIVALVNGMALGGGLELALCADEIYAVPEAVLAFPETGIGIYPGLGGTQRTTRKIGKGLSKYLIFTGKMLSAKNAEEIGLVDKIISPEEMLNIQEGIAPLPEINKFSISEKWQDLGNFFEVHSVAQIINGIVSGGRLSTDEIEKLTKILRRKAPIALQKAEKLINEARGCESELEELCEIFSTSDALLGLTSIGKKVEYQGK